MPFVRRSGSKCYFWLLVVTVISAGCNSAPPAPVTDGQVYSSFDEVKQRLEEVAKNGDGGSSLMGLSESIEKLRATDAEKATTLAHGVKQLEAAPTTEQRKAIATKMLEGMK